MAEETHMSLDDMATALSFSGYLVYGPDDAMPEHTWKHIGEKEGYFNTLEAEDAVADAVTFLKARGYSIIPPPQDAETPEAWPGVAERAGLLQEYVHDEEASRPAMTARQGKEVSLENTASPTVLEHCMASEARQGKTVVREDILYELRMRGIPSMARWDDWSAEVARLCPGRWEV